ncbi:MAG: basic membrane protein A [Verrucomicrobiales bacterium]|jgi:basic membrane protein A
MRRQITLILTLLATFSLLAAACGSDEAASPIEGCPLIPSADGVDENNDFTVALAFDLLGRGDQSFNDSAACGIETAKVALGIDFSESVPNPDGSNRADILQLGADNSDLVIGVGFEFETDGAAVGSANPGTKFAVIDSGMLDFANDAVPYGDNIAGLVFAEHEGSFLVGAAAALSSDSGKLGFIGGVSGLGGLIERFEAGFVAGAKEINPDIEVTVQYISAAPDFAGFGAADQAKDIANAMYANGADVVYHAAGGSGAGLFQAAKETSEAGDKVWAIGVDSDQYNTAGADVQEFILTSMLKRVDVAVYEIIAKSIAGDIDPGPTTYDLSVDGVGYSRTGGFLDDHIDALEELKTKVVSGEITVSKEP